MNVSSLTLDNVFLALTAWGAAFLVALWASLIIWTYRDIKSRARDPLIHFLAATVVALLFLPGILIYLILRPTLSIEEEYQQSLEEEALLQTIEDNQLCPGCGRRIKETWQICPNCQTKLRKPCHQCGELMELPWNICPYCGEPAPGMRRDGLTMDDALRNIPPNSGAEDNEEDDDKLEANPQE